MSCHLISSHLVSPPQASLPSASMISCAAHPGREVLPSFPTYQPTRKHKPTHTHTHTCTRCRRHVKYAPCLGTQACMHVVARRCSLVLAVPWLGPAVSCEAAYPTSLNPISDLLHWSGRRPGWLVVMIHFLHTSHATHAKHARLRNPLGYLRYARLFFFFFSGYSGAGALLLGNPPDWAWRAGAYPISYP